ncbi:MAG: metallophosphoesterase family protein [Planctomycetota bacterium]
MKIAVISDIHANLAAFESVLEDVRGVGVDRIYCLGDIIGYGPDPRACLEIARRFDLNLLGNHEDAVLFGAIGFNPKAKAAIEWTRDQLNSRDEPQDKNRELWNFLGEIEQRRQQSEGPFLFVHGSPRDPTREYVFKQDFQDRRKMDELFAAPPDVEWRVCFAGHTHHPGIFAQAHPYAFFEPAEIEMKYRYAEIGHRLLVNVGSVGQPRDGDWRASYAIVDDEWIVFRRVEYDVQKTVRRFKEFPELPEYLARRLEEGK